ncbi:DNA cytosine methyltransferase [Paenibacillus macquariensis]|uniref:DNA (cytosine-5-)-methyltransferase n=1 Tax=Paenibacillus macquariensis TaxID=948756 RepID=A0ABY1KD04_9BACL|nr:DNA cytosine methyltransferase [Paenibacillus macquariensis]MEC0093218.1 DNA cytosine methyltransferase [Paenibacillus macquariensis]OAB35039.1 DNA methyltransferase [Paenibacillus macquariensis subsp. macquariensis]SIR62931.1 DNA (cytosine-5)-methyltransferase 1 [Paenibacillus macquariensis]
MAVAISFFSGAGGLDIGMKKSGFDVRLTVEIEETYCETLKTNHPEMNIIQGDIMDYSRERILMEAGLNEEDEIDLMFGGSPCQSFSTAGKRQAFGDPRGQAMLKFAELVRETKPKVFLLENVKGLLSAAIKHRPINQRGDNFPTYEPDELPGSALNFLLEQFKGYNVNYKLINSADYGVPQTRERVFFVGVREDLGAKFEFPIATHSKDGLGRQKKWVSVGDALESIEINEHHFVEYSPDRLQYMKMIPQGGGYWRNLPDDVVKNAMGGAYESGGGKVGFFRRLWIDRPAPTMLTSPIQKSTNLGHPYEDRPLSIEEYLTIQQFPIDYRVSGSLTKQYIQIGNAVPVGLAEILGKSILRLLQEITAWNKMVNEVAVTR